jgi:hypothetical protein
MGPLRGKIIYNSREGTSARAYSCEAYTQQPHTTGLQTRWWDF